MNIWKKSVNAQLLNFVNSKLCRKGDREKIIFYTNFAVSRFNFYIPDFLDTCSKNFNRTRQKKLVGHCKKKLWDRVIESLSSTN